MLDNHDMLPFISGGKINPPIQHIGGFGIDL